MSELKCDLCGVVGDARKFAVLVTPGRPSQSRAICRVCLQIDYPMQWRELQAYEARRAEAKRAAA